MTAYTWIGGTGNWNVASNWSPGSPAGPLKATDTATISATGGPYLDFPSPGKAILC